MGYVLLGVAALGAGRPDRRALQMFTHGTITALLFVMVGVIYDRAHTREIDRALRAWRTRCRSRRRCSSSPGWRRWGCRRCPASSPSCWSSSAAFDTFAVPTIVAVFGILLSAGYILWTVQRVFFGPPNERWAHLPDANRVVGAACRWPRCVVVIIGVGIYPAIVVDVLETGIVNIVEAAELMLHDLDRLGPVLVVMVTAALIIVTRRSDACRGREQGAAAGVALAGPGASRRSGSTSLILRDREASFFSDSMALDNFSIFFIVPVHRRRSGGHPRVAGLRRTLRRATRASSSRWSCSPRRGMMLLAGARDLIADLRRARADEHHAVHPGRLPARRPRQRGRREVPAARRDRRRR